MSVIRSLVKLCNILLIEVETEDLEFQKSEGAMTVIAASSLTIVLLMSDSFDVSEEGVVVTIRGPSLEPMFHSLERM